MLNKIIRLFHTGLIKRLPEFKRWNPCYNPKELTKRL